MVEGVSRPEISATRFGVLQLAETGSDIGSCPFDSRVSNHGNS